MPVGAIELPVHKLKFLVPSLIRQHFKHNVVVIGESEKGFRQLRSRHSGSREAISLSSAELATLSSKYSLVRYCRTSLQ